MAVFSNELLVLRFRDLSVEPGQTIVRHRRVIAEHDECWWGWWARRQEEAPLGFLPDLVFPRTIALYDTDQSLVFTADCQEGRASETEVLSPRPDWTPTYYNNRRLRAWFRIAEIWQATPEILLGRRCLRTANPTVEPGWEVQSLVSLRESESTMWLLSSREG